MYGSTTKRVLPSRGKHLRCRMALCALFDPGYLFPDTATLCAGDYYDGIIDPRIKFGLRKGEYFVKTFHFPAIFFCDNDFFSLIELISIVDPLHQK